MRKFLLIFTAKKYAVWAYLYRKTVETKIITPMKILKSVLAMAALLSVPAGAAAYTTTFNLPATFNGKTIVITNFDTEHKIDSVVAADGKAVFNTERKMPCLATMEVDGNTVVENFILDQADIVVDVTFAGADAPAGVMYSSAARGGLNDEQKRFFEDIEILVNNYKNNANRQLDNELPVQMHEMILAEVKRNIFNPLGYYILVALGPEWLTQDFTALTRDYPSIEKYNKVQAMLAFQRGLEATQVNKKYTNFGVEYNGKEHHLSDVVGKGDYVLLDFWASWCGPCRKAMPAIKKAQEDFKGKPLKIIGVAVWDEPENSMAAAKQWGLTWPVWVNGKEDITTNYGIDGIPCFILIGPDGTILARNFSVADLPSVLKKFVK